MKKTKKYLLMAILGISLFALSSCTRHFCSDTDRTNIIMALVTKQEIMDKAKTKADELAVKRLEEETVNPTDQDYQTKKVQYSNEAYEGTAWSKAENLAKANLTEKGITEDNPSYATKLVEEKNSEFIIILNRAISGSGEEKKKANDSLGTLYQGAKDYYFSNNYAKVCIAVEDTKDPVSGATIEGKNWGDTWKFGPVEFFLVYPIAWLIIMIASLLGNTAASAVFGLVMTTIVVRVLTVAFSIKSTVQSQKMTALQPEINALQAKYAGSKDPNAKTLQSQELMKIYQKAGVNPLSSLITPFLTLPIFIAMWGAVNGVTLLRQGTFLTLGLGDQLFNNLTKAPHISAAIAAWILLALMISSQFVSMKLPIWLNKKNKNQKFIDEKTKAMQQSTNMMSNVMLIMIVGMGLYLPTAMSIYWTISSALTIVQQYAINKYIIQKENR